MQGEILNLNNELNVCNPGLTLAVLFRHVYITLSQKVACIGKFRRKSATETKQHRTKIGKKNRGMGFSRTSDFQFGT